MKNKKMLYFRYFRSWWVNVYTLSLISASRIEFHTFIKWTLYWMNHKRVRYGKPIQTKKRNTIEFSRWFLLVHCQDKTDLKQPTLVFIIIKKCKQTTTQMIQVIIKSVWAARTQVDVSIIPLVSHTNTERMQH